MFKQDKRTLLMDITVVLAVSLGILVAASVFPLLAPLIPLTSVAFAYMMLKHGKGYFFAALLWYGTGVWIFGNLDMLMVVTLITGVNGYVLARICSQQMKPSKAILMMGLSSLAIIVMLSESSMLATGVSFTQAYGDSAHKMVQTMMTQPEFQGQTFSTTFKTQLQEFDQFIDVFLVVLPSFMILFAMFWGFVTYTTARWIFRKVGIEMPAMQKLREFNYPSSVIPGTMAIVAVAYVAAYTMPMDLDMVISNLMVLLMYFFAVQGAAATSRFFTKLKNGQLLSFITIALLVLNGIMFLGLIGLVSLFKQGFKVEN